MSLSFVGIGAQKCGSSWISAVLSDHPDIAMSESEPLDFFSYRFENGYRWYEKQLPDAGTSICIGEMSQSYFHEPGVVDRIWNYNSEVKIIVSLRDPVERALSQHRHLVRLGIVPEDDLSFETALSTNPTYFEQGRYFTHLSRWIERFGRNRIHIVLMEDIVSHPECVVEALYRFLDVRSDHRPAAIEQVVNASYVPRYRVLERSVRRLSDLIRSNGGESALRVLRGMGLKTAYERLNRKKSDSAIPRPMPETLARLRIAFDGETRGLSALLNRDLSRWQ